jgi:uncharacterized protein YbjT (DUF2867 family)
MIKNMRLGLFCILFMNVSAFASDNDVLVFGGTGRLGAPIVTLLVEAGYPVTVFARQTSDRERLEGLDIQYATGDLLNVDEVVAAFEQGDFRFVIDATSRSGNEGVFYDDAMANILRGVSVGNVTQILYHGSIGAGDNMKEFPDIDFSRLRDVLLAKGRAETMLIESGTTYTIIRNGMVRLDGTPATGTADLIEDTSVNGPVTRADLALLTMECIGNKACFNRIYHAVDN